MKPKTGEGFFLVLAYCNTICMNVSLKQLSAAYPDDFILPVADGTAWHKSKGLEIPSNIGIFPLPPYTPEMNPIEQIWKELRKRGFKNEIFQILENVADRLCDTIPSLSAFTIKSITDRNRILYSV